jgi:hypothetical protein
MLLQSAGSTAEDERDNVSQLRQATQFRVNEVRRIEYSPKYLTAVAPSPLPLRVSQIPLERSPCARTAHPRSRDRAEVLQEPIDQPWGPRDCAFRDPSGNTVRIAQAPAA